MVMIKLVWHQNYKNHSVEAKLKKFYSTFNQAVAMSIAENGDVALWYEDDLTVFMKKDENGNYTSEGLVWFNNYIGKYMNIVETDRSYIGNPLFKLSDGSSFTFFNEGTTRDILFYTIEEDKCRSLNVNTRRDYLGVCGFAFIFNPNSLGRGHKNKWLEPYADGWNGTEERLYSGCEESGTYCTKLIQYNGWKIPKDYPRKVR